MDTLVDVNMWHAAGHALLMLLEPQRLIYLIFGVAAGLVIGVIPGVGGLTGFALLIPFTYTMDPMAAIAMLIGMQAVTSTSDSIPAVLIGVPGEASAQALVLDGHQMARRGEAARALAAGYTSSMLGGIIGAVILAFTIPMIRPFVLAFGTPELFAITAMALAMVSTLSGRTPLRGLTIACFGILLAMVGTDPQTAQPRWNGGFLYLWDGIPLVPVMLGFFALPELCDLAISRSAMAKSMEFDPRKGRRDGVMDALRNWFIIVRSSVLAVALGAIPGFSGAVVNWMAYGQAARTVKGANKTFGTGDVRGVIAPEAAANAIDSGSLGTTLVFGIPGSAARAMLIAALLIHGITPGPKMLTEHLDITYSMVWSMALANVFGTLACVVLSVQFARLATLRYSLLLPAVLTIIYIGAYQASNDWWDLVVLLIAGAAGWLLKRLGWPRPPFVLGFVLGGILEQYLGISINRYGVEFLTHPIVFVILLFAAAILTRPLFTEIRHSGLSAMFRMAPPRFRPTDIVYVVLIGVTGLMLTEAAGWPFAARVGPQTVGTVLLIAASLSFFHVVTTRGLAQPIDTSHRGVHIDTEDDDDEENGLPLRQVVLRAAQFFGWLIAFMASMSVIGLIPTTPLFVVAFMRLQGRESWRISLIHAAATTVFVYLVFDQAMRVLWPPTILGQHFPELARYFPSM